MSACVPPGAATRVAVLSTGRLRDLSGGSAARAPTARPHQAAGGGGPVRARATGQAGSSKAARAAGSAWVTALPTAGSPTRIAEITSSRLAPSDLA